MRALARARRGRTRLSDSFLALRAVASFAVVLLASACGEPGSPLATSTPLPPASPIPLDVSPAMHAMLLDLPAFVMTTRLEQQRQLPDNQQFRAQIEAKIAVLGRPGLVSEVYEGRRFLEGAAASPGGATIPVVAVFPVEAMREEAAGAIRIIERGFPVLEAFMRTPFPHPAVRIWYGFKLGNAGGSGTVNTEDGRPTKHGPGRAGCCTTRSCTTSWRTPISATSR